MTSDAPADEREEVRAEKDAQVLRREAVEQELMQEGRSGAGTRLDDVEDDDSGEEPR